mmetsp:Transcript_30349/g.92822  ORF Transcript_30349/g.92822 Transcript_30349/m.92822 type:complete len:266 (+) Transcript_30349:1826-2623(+)
MWSSFSRLESFSSDHRVEPAGRLCVHEKARSCGRSKHATPPVPSGSMISTRRKHGAPRSVKVLNPSVSSDRPSSVSTRSALLLTCLGGRCGLARFALAAAAAASASLARLRRCRRSRMWRGTPKGSVRLSSLSLSKSSSKSSRPSTRSSAVEESVLFASASSFRDSSLTSCLPARAASRPVKPRAATPLRWPAARRTPTSLRPRSQCEESVSRRRWSLFKRSAASGYGAFSLADREPTRWQKVTSRPSAEVWSATPDTHSVSAAT